MLWGCVVIESGKLPRSIFSRKNSYPVTFRGVKKSIMIDVASRSAGSSVVFVTSHDDDHPPENIIDGDQQTFWSSTGLYPQEFIVSFPSQMNVSKVDIACYNVKNIAIEKCDDPDPLTFERISEKELSMTEGSLQQEEFKANNVRCQHLRVIIESGYDHFVSVHRLSVDGNAAR